MDAETTEAVLDAIEPVAPSSADVCAAIADAARGEGGEAKVIVTLHALEARGRATARWAFGRNGRVRRRYTGRGGWRAFLP